MIDREFIPVNKPLFTGNEKSYLAECIDSGWVSSDGPFVEKFEDGLKNTFKRKYSVAVSSGSAALDIAIASLGIGKGDEVILPSHTIISCASSVTKSGAIPVLVDSNKETWNMSIDDIESKITNKTKAIMAVHLYGLPLDMDPILDLAKKYSLFVIEDAAEMIGQTYKDRMCGSLGDISIMSFYPNKHITTGEGGVCLTDNEDLADKCKYYRNLCFEEPRFVHKDLGWNYRMTNMQAALGLAQLENLDKHVSIKREIGKKYNDLLKDIDNIYLGLEETDFSKNIYWVFGIVLKENTNIDAKTVMSKLSDIRIGSRPFFYPINKQPVYAGKYDFESQNFPISEYLSLKGFYVPSGLGISPEEIEFVSKELIKILT